MSRGPGPENAPARFADVRRARGSTVGFDASRYPWREVSGSPDSPYRIHHDMCLLGWDREAGTLDLMIRFDAEGGHCNAHRHVCTTSVLVIEGEQHIEELRPDGTRLPKMRKAGDHHLMTGEQFPHLERGGPEGGVLFFSHHTTDGRLYEIVELDGRVVHTVTLDSLVATWESER